MAQTPEGARKVRAAKLGISVEEYSTLVASGKKHCYACNEWKSNSDFCGDSSRFDGFCPRCRDCVNSRSRELYAPIPAHLQKPKGSAPKPSVSGNKKQARGKVAYAVQKGEIPAARDLACSDCGHVWKEGEKKHEYHHFMGYDAEYHMTVKPLCSMCHHSYDNLKKNQTHCIRGHEFTKENTILPKEGGRACRECAREYDRKRKRPKEYWKAVNARRRKNG